MDNQIITDETAKLTELTVKLQEIISEAEQLKSKPAFYEGVKNILELKQWIVDLGIDEELVKKRFEEFEEVCLAISTSDFRRMEIHNYNDKDLFTHIATSINTVSEQLEQSTTKKHYLEEAIEHIPDFAIITDHKGVIRFANEAACKILNLNKENVIKLKVANIFKSKTRFGTKAEMASSFKDKKVTLTPYNAPEADILLTVKELINSITEETDGHLYLGKM